MKQLPLEAIPSLWGRRCEFFTLLHAKPCSRRRRPRTRLSTASPPPEPPTRPSSSGGGPTTSSSWRSRALRLRAARPPPAPRRRAASVTCPPRRRSAWMAVRPPRASAALRRAATAPKLTRAAPAICAQLHCDSTERRLGHRPDGRAEQGARHAPALPARPRFLLRSRPRAQRPVRFGRRGARGQAGRGARAASAREGHAAQREPAGQQTCVCVCVCVSMCSRQSGSI